jgi:hypothetical protein
MTRKSEDCRLAHLILIRERSRPLFRDDVAHHSGMISPGVGASAGRLRSFPLARCGISIAASRLAGFTTFR